jgi:hypothetical protein
LFGSRPTSAQRSGIGPHCHWGLIWNMPNDLPNGHQPSATRVASEGNHDSFSFHYKYRAPDGLC